MWPVRFVAGVLVWTLLAGCTAGAGEGVGSEGSGVSASVAVEPAEPASAGAGGVVVELPTGAVSGPGALTVDAIDTAALEGVPDRVTPLMPVSVTLQGAELIEPATITFPAPDVRDSEPQADALVVMWQDTAGRWRLLPSERVGDQITAQTDHFSRGFLGSVDVGKWASEKKTDLANYLSGRSGVEQPSCGDEKAARAGGVTVDSDGGDAVKWCYGIDNGQTVLRIANNRRSFATVTYPKAWKVKDGSSVSISPDAAARVLGAAATDLVQLGKNRAARTINGGDTLTLIVGENGSGKATVEGDFVAWAFSAIVFGIDVYSAVATSLRVNPKDSDTYSRFVDVVTGGGDSGYLDTFTGCTRAYMDELGEAASAVDLPKTLDQALKFMWSCIPQLMTADYAAVGIGMFGAGAVLRIVGGVVGLVLTAVHLLVTGVREIYDNFAAFGGKSDPIYDITIRQPKIQTDNALYYAFAFKLDPGQPTGCGPQARFVKIIGDEFFYVAGFGCDATADRGTIKGDKVELIGLVGRCGDVGTQYFPTTLQVSGGATNLQIPDETRVVGPTASLAELDDWWEEENGRVDYPSPSSPNHVTEWMRAAAESNWTGYGC